MTELHAFHDAILAAARTEADRVLDTARADASAELGAAHADAEAVREHARQRGRDAGRQQLQRQVAEGRQQAREQVLRARREALGDLRDAVLARLDDARSSDDYRRLLERLANAARQQLGCDAEVIGDDESGGIVGRNQGRSVDYTLPALVDREVEELVGQLEELWR